MLSHQAAPARVDDFKRLRERSEGPREILRIVARESVRHDRAGTGCYRQLRFVTKRRAWEKDKRVGRIGEKGAVRRIERHTLPGR